MGLFNRSRKDRKRDSKGRYVEEPTRIPTPPQPSIKGRDKLLFTFGEELSSEPGTETPSYDAMVDVVRGKAVPMTREQLTQSKDKEEKLVFKFGEDLTGYGDQAKEAQKQKDEQTYQSTLDWLRTMDHSADGSGIPCYCPACDPSDESSEPVKRAVQEYCRVRHSNISDYDSYDPWDG